MCCTRQRAITLLAMQTYLTRELERLHEEGASAEEIARRWAELEMVDDEIAAAVSDPRAASLLIGWAG